MTLLDQIKNIDFHSRSGEQITDIENAFQFILPHVKSEYKELLRHDFDHFIQQGRYILLNTISGGIIFLREPEIIERITIEFSTEQNEAHVSVEYSSELRNARNVKYKPEAGKIESTRWKMLWIFPNFKSYERSVQLVLMTIIGEIVKSICEYENKNSWYMKYLETFDLELVLDQESIEKITITAID